MSGECGDQLGLFEVIETSELAIWMLWTHSQWRRLLSTQTRLHVCSTTPKSGCKKKRPEGVAFSMTANIEEQPRDGKPSTRLTWWKAGTWQVLLGWYRCDRLSKDATTLYTALHRTTHTRLARTALISAKHITALHRVSGRIRCAAKPATRCLSQRITRFPLAGS